VRHHSKPRRSFWLALVLAGSSVAALSQSDPRQTAFSLEQQGRVAEAESAWRALSQAQPANPEPLAHLGLLEARQEHYPEAISLYRKALSLKPEMPGLRWNLGLAYFKAGEYKSALPIFEPLFKAQPPSSDQAQQLAILIGMSHYGLAEYAAAEPWLKRAADGDPKNLPLLLTWAHSCLFVRQFPCVLDVYHRVVALNAESAEADMLVGEALDEMKDPVGAQREFRAAVAADPKEPNVHFGLGYLLWTKGQYPEAAQQFQAEIDNNPHHLQAVLYLADSEMQMNRMEEARPLLEKLAKLDPDNSMEHLDLGIVYTDQGRKEDALVELKTAARLAPDDVNVHWRLGRLYHSMGKNAEARSELAKAGSLNKAADQRLLKVMSKIPGNEQTSQTAPSASPQQ
jgi:tetratricopeptide (TPR) repeat protein